MSATRPYVQLTITVEKLDSGETTTISGRTKDTMLTVEDDLTSDPITWFDPLREVRPIEQRKVSVVGKVVADYQIRVDKQSPQRRLEHLLAIEAAARAYSESTRDSDPRNPNQTWRDLNDVLAHGASA